MADDSTTLDPARSQVARLARALVLLSDTEIEEVRPKAMI
jgi:hypothetical protein